MQEPVRLHQPSTRFCRRRLEAGGGSRVRVLSGSVLAARYGTGTLVVVWHAGPKPAAFSAEISTS
jgi:hypothetical protein